VQGWKLILMSSRPWHNKFRRMRFFFAGVLMILITVTALYASTVYNIAIARSNPELVENAVIVLYLVDVDEQLYGFMEVACPDRLEKMMGKSSSPDNSNKSDETSANDETPQKPRWTAVGNDKLRWSSVEGDKFVDNKISANVTGTDHTHEINDLYAKLYKLEDKFDQQDKARGDTVLAGMINQGGAAHDDTLYQVQNEHRAQLTTLEKKIDDLRLALQVHKSSSQLMSESIRHLYGRTSVTDGELS